MWGGGGAGFGFVGGGGGLGGGGGEVTHPLHPPLAPPRDRVQCTRRVNSFDSKPVFGKQKTRAPFWGQESRFRVRRSLCVSVFQGE